MAKMEEEQVAHRLRAIKLAEQLGNVAEACRRTGIDRTSFYEWKRRYDALGEGGLFDRPSRHKHHPHCAGDAVVSRVTEIAITHPSLGCNRIEALLESDGHSLSSTSVQKILRKAGLATQRDRWLAMDRPFKTKKPPFSPEQMDFLVQVNPCWRDRGSAGAYPGEFLVNGAFLLAPKKGMAIFVHCAADVMTSVARAHIWLHRETHYASNCLDDLRKYFERDLGLPGPKACTTYGFESWSRSHIRRKGWRHLRLPFATRPKIGAFDRFRQTVLDEFPTFLARDPALMSKEELNEAMVSWTQLYNETRPFHGYPNYGLPPAQAAERASKEGLEQLRTRRNH